VILPLLCSCGGASASAVDGGVASEASTPPSADGALPVDASADGPSSDSDVSPGNEQDVSLSSDGGGITCRVDGDCPQPSGQYCVACFEGGVDCARSQCVAGACVGHAANCPGPMTNACAYKGCGDPCQQCSTYDGGCYAGTCNWFNECKQAVPVCSISATYGCAPSDAVGVGDCNDFLGWGWDGSKCSPVVGCLCQGSDCVGLTTGSASDCLGNYSQCPQDGG
jgi:hypothetical protein